MSRRSPSKLVRLTGPCACAVHPSAVRSSTRAMKASKVEARRVGAGWMTALVVLLALGIAPASVAAATGHRRLPQIKVLTKPAAATVGEQIVVSGRVKRSVGNRTHYRVDLQTKMPTSKHKRLVTWASAKLDSRSRFSISYRVGAEPGAVTIRLRLRKGQQTVTVTKPWQLRISAATPAAKQTVVLDPSTVSEVPAPGQPGQMRVAGNLDASPGDIIAVGVGSATPYGFLGKVVSVSHDASSTTLQTVPATLPEALPEGSFAGEIDPPPLDSEETTGTSAAASTRSQGMQVRALFDCGGTAKITVGGTVHVDPRIEISGGWGLFSGPRVRFVGYMTGNGTLSIAATAGASCTLQPKTLLYRPLAAITFAVGPVPVVVVPVVSAVLSGDGSVEGGVSTNLSGSVNAHAGIEYHDGQAHPVGGVDPTFTGGTPPNPQGSGHVHATLSPAIELLLYGVAGPQTDLNVGLAMDATVGQTPFWTLSSPVSMTAKMNIPALNISTSELSIYQHTFVIAQG